MKLERSLPISCFLLVSIFFASPSWGWHESPFDKRADESWDIYMARLVDAGKIDETQLNSWIAGESVAVAVPFHIVRTRKEHRVQTVPVRKTRVAKNGAGEEVEETYTENVEKTVIIEVPYVEIVMQNTAMPVRGSEPDDATYSGFSKNAQGLPKSAASGEFDTALESSKKLASEKWASMSNVFMNSGCFLKNRFSSGPRARPSK